MNHQSQFDLAIVGAGAFGLSIAREFANAGYSVVVVEQNNIGSGASGGNLGALMPHMPARWDPNKEFQFKALATLSDYIHELETETGYSVGYRRVGRLIPLFSDHMLRHSEERAKESQIHWNTNETGFEYQVLENFPISEWMAPTASPLAYAYDSFAARLLPWRYVKALHKSIESKCTILEQTKALKIAPSLGEIVIVESNDIIKADRIVLAAGFESFRILEELGCPLLGVGIKGQSVLLRGQTPDEMPIIFDDGVFIVPHFDGTVAIGSSSIENWTDQTKPELEKLDFFERAKKICTPLRDMEVIAHWANVRPKCFERDPLIGLVPGFENFFVATGGFKIGLGLVHHLATALFEIMMKDKRSVVVPTTYTTEYHWQKTLEAAFE